MAYGTVHVNTAICPCIFLFSVKLDEKLSACQFMNSASIPGGKVGFANHIYLNVFGHICSNP